MQKIENEISNSHKKKQTEKLNYHFSHMWSDTDGNKLYFHSLHESFICTANKHGELNYLIVQ